MVIIRSKKILFLAKEDSHEEIIKAFGLGDDKLFDRDFVRIEVKPKGELLSVNPNDWEFKVDEEETLPEWFDEKFWEGECIREMTEKIIPKFDLNYESLYLRGCTGLTSLPEGLKAESLYLRGCTGLTSLPEGLTVGHLDLRGCTGLTSLPEGLKAGHLDLAGCTGLTSLPEGLEAESLYLAGCTGLTSLPEGLKVGKIIE
jgi:hypothetical protein